MQSLKKEMLIVVEPLAIPDHRTNECIDLQCRFERQDDYHLDLRMGERGTSINSERFIGYHFGAGRRNFIQPTLATLGRDGH